jgi:hypothetical protein
LSHPLQGVIRDVDVSVVRKCGSCGYLLFGDGDTCNHCGAAVASTPAPAPAPLSRPTAVATATQTRPPDVRPPVALPVAPPSPRTFDAPPPGAWQPVPVAVAPPEKSSNLRVVAVFALVACLALGAIGVYLRGKASALPPGTGDFVAGRGVSYTPPDNAFRVQLPADPEVDSQPVTVGSVTMTVQEALVQTDDYEIGAASMSLPASIPDSRVDDTLESSLKDGVSSVDGDLVSKERITRGGLPALDATFKAKDGYSAHIMVILDTRYVYMLIVHAKTGTERLFGALNTSFVPTIRR